MSVRLLTSRDAVLAAITECDRLGREAFLTKYGYGPARRYLLEYEGRFYDSKAIAGAAVGFEHPSRGPLRREEFSGGDSTVRPVLEQLGFRIVSPRERGTDARQLWWVNQGQTYDVERAGGYVWAPQRGQGGRLVGHHQNLAQLKPDDLILHYARGLVRAIGVVTDPAREASRPSELPENQWGRDGYLAEVAYHEAPTPIALEEIPISWRTDDSGPFTRHGAVKQGYMFPISARFATRIGEEFGRRWPDLQRLLGDLEDMSGLSEFLRWGKKFYESGDFEQDERAYKLTVAEAVAAARTAFLHNGDWRAAIKQALRHRDNNLLDWRLASNLSKWVDEDQSAADAFAALWQNNDPLAGAEAFLANLPIVPGLGRRATVASFFLMSEDATKYPIYKTTPLATSYRLSGFPKPPEGADGVGVYQHALSFFDALLDGAPEQGFALRDRLDAQGMVWALTKTKPTDHPIIDWPEQEQLAFLRWRGEEIPDISPGGLDALAESLLLDVNALREIETLLREKGQVIFYGPPGTGKTFVARQLALHFAESSNRVTLVQFHPSYAYEDFVEGYRPREVNGQPGFGLVPGPFAAIAERARQSPDELFVLIIDEINRGNVAKVFGELYFLLEYRDEAINLQYSASEFRLPQNLWLIGTMNTADRSIALLDAALRRRFYFVPFFPDERPISGLLRRWLGRNKPELDWVADVVDHANSRLGDRNAGIGPSYFMRPNLTEEWVERIWQYAIIPYLGEHFFGEEERLTEFTLERLRYGIPNEPDELTESDDEPDSSA